MPDINLYDSVSTAEDVTLGTDNYITVNETVMVSEAVETCSVFTLSVSDATVVTEYISGTTVTFIKTDPIDIPKVPVVYGEAAFRETITIEGTAPTTEGESFFGSVIEGIVPTADATIILQGLFAGYITVTGNTPVAEGNGLFGSFIFGKAPTVSCTASLVNNSIRVSGYAPVVTAEITIPNYIISISGYAPFSVVKSVFNFVTAITVAGIAPASYGNTVLTTAGLLSIDGVAPIAESTYNSIKIGGSYISITGTAPVGSILYASGEEDSGSFTITTHSRFDTVILEYARWPDAI